MLCSVSYFHEVKHVISDIFHRISTCDKKNLFNPSKMVDVALFPLKEKNELIIWIQPTDLIQLTRHKLVINTAK